METPGCQTHSSFFPGQSTKSSILFCIHLLTGKIPFKEKLRTSRNIITGYSVLEFAEHFPSHRLSHFFLLTTLKNRAGVFICVLQMRKWKCKAFDYVSNQAASKGS